MYVVRVAAVRWVDEEWPGWVEVLLTESDGSVVSIVDKVPVLDGDGRLTPGGSLPVGLELPCDVLERRADGGAVIRLRSDVEDRDGRTTFTVDGRSLSEAS
ncbi:hypothetical protein Val02_22100 [Virgisporangium aliadipatigenens]|uniref:Uncharacterized protein n=1 Tax=Virgisporangium aliadipatigenens TaxID=741659 RepID=A0A8J4DPA9_9ACTN|nr:hypothetical protein [Virgisporangium aliadipatigenens]GIJ45324.1 hypothetical protein Val02_22100 [Virgisporangium aliadipatigenens]